MKYLIVLASALALCSCKPVEDNYVNVQQDTVGNYEVQLRADDFVKSEKGTQDGHVVGSYTYVDGDGVPQKVHYTAGVEGFVVEGTNLPVPVVDTEEVVQARNDHLNTKKEILKIVPITDEFDQTDRDVVRTSLRSHHGLVPVIKYVEREVPIDSPYFIKYVH